jgi:hypothetical protein
MKKPVTLFLIFILIVNILKAQEAKQPFLEKTNQLSLSVEALSVSFSYAYKFSKNATFGVQVQAGAGIRILLNNPTFNYFCDQCTAPHKEKVKSVTNLYVEVMKAQLFYRMVLNKRFYVDGGPYASIGISSFEADAGGTSLGIELSGYYTRNIFFVGLRLQSSFVFIDYWENLNNNFFGLFLTPLVIGVNF